MSLRKNSSCSNLYFPLIGEENLINDKRFSKYNNAEIPGKNISRIPTTFLSKGMYNIYFNNVDKQYKHNKIKRESFKQESLDLKNITNYIMRTNEEKSRMNYSTFYNGKNTSRNFFNNQQYKFLNSDSQEKFRKTISIDRNFYTKKNSLEKCTEKINLHLKANSHNFTNGKFFENSNVKILSEPLKIKNKNVLGNHFSKLSLFKNSKNFINKKYDNIDIISKQFEKEEKVDQDLEQNNFQDNKESSIVDSIHNKNINNNNNNLTNETFRNLSNLDSYMIQPNLILTIKKKRKKANESSMEFFNFNERSDEKNLEATFTKENIYNKTIDEEYKRNIQEMNLESNLNVFKIDDEITNNENQIKPEIIRSKKEKSLKNSEINHKNFINKNNIYCKNYRNANETKDVMNLSEYKNLYQIETEEYDSYNEKNNPNKISLKSFTHNTFSKTTSSDFKMNLKLNRNYNETDKLNNLNNSLNNNDSYINEIKENYYSKSTNKIIDDKKTQNLIKSYSNKSHSNIISAFLNNSDNKNGQYNLNFLSVNNNANKINYANCRLSKESEIYQQNYNNNLTTAQILSSTNNYYCEKTSVKHINLNLKYNKSNLRDAFTDTKISDPESIINDNSKDIKNGNYNILNSKTNSMLKISTILKKDIIIQDLLNRKYNKTNSYNILSNNNRKILAHNNIIYEKPILNNHKNGINNVLNEVYLNIPDQNKKRNSSFYGSELNNSTTNFNITNNSMNNTENKDPDNLIINKTFNNLNSKSIEKTNDIIKLENLNSDNNANSKSFISVNNNKRNENNNSLNNIVYSKTNNLNILKKFNTNEKIFRNNNNMNNPVGIINITYPKFNGNFNAKDYHISITEEKETSKIFENETEDFENKEKVNNSYSNRDNFSRGNVSIQDFHEIKSNSFNKIIEKKASFASYEDKRRTSYNTNFHITNNANLNKHEENKKKENQTPKKFKSLNENINNFKDVKEKVFNYIKEEVKKDNNSKITNKSNLQNNIIMICNSNEHLENELIFEQTNPKTNYYSKQNSNENNSSLIIINNNNNLNVNQKHYSTNKNEFKKESIMNFKFSGNSITNNQAHLVGKNLGNQNVVNLNNLNKNSINNETNNYFSNNNDKFIEDYILQKENFSKNRISTGNASVNSLDSVSSTNNAQYPIIKQKINTLDRILTNNFRQKYINDKFSREFNENNDHNMAFNNFNNTFIKKSLAENKSKSNDKFIHNRKTTVYTNIK